MSARGIVAEAFALRRACREEYEQYLDSVFAEASEDCRGALLNALGRERGIDARSLFMGSADRAALYASEELVEWWYRSRARMNYRQFEEQWLKGRDREGFV